MSTVAAIAITLAALAVGALIMVAVELRATLKSARRFFDESAPRFEVALERISDAGDRIGRMADGIEATAHEAKELLDGSANLVQEVNRIKDSVRRFAAIGSAVGPAVAAAVHAFVNRESGSDRVASRADEGEAEAEPPETHRFDKRKEARS